MGNACQPVGYSIDEGMKAFCVAEMCVGLYHLLVAFQIFRVVEPMINPPDEGRRYSKKRDTTILEGIIIGLYFLLMLTLIIQFVMGLLLYFLGFKKRNVTICFAWVVVACFSFATPWLILVFGAMHCGSGDDRKCYVTVTIWVIYWLYLLYLILGVWIVIVYMKWAKSTGIAVQYSSTPASGTAPSQSHRSAKVANQDNEA